MTDMETSAGDSAGLTAMQAAFVRHVALDCMTQTKAAEAAGYAQPAARAVELVRTPHVMAAIHAARSAIINTDLAALGLRTMRDLMADPSNPAPVRFQAAKWSLEAAGHKAEQDKAGLPAHERPLHEMSLTELESFIARGEGALSKLRNVGPTIDVQTDSNAPNIPPDNRVSR